MADQRILKFAIIGCGRIHSKHAEALVNSKIKNAQLVCACEPVDSKRREFEVKYKVPCFTSQEEMYLKYGKSIDVVSILTPSGLHAEHAILAMRQGKHVVVEKPMALKLADADKMILEADKNRVRLFVVKQNRFNPPIMALKNALDKGLFGKLVMGTVRVRWCRTQEYYDLDNWRGTWALDGGVLTNQASHHIDVLTWMLGDVESVFAKTATFLVNIEAEDTGVAVLRFSSGALGIIEATTATRPKDIEGSLSILGELGMVEVGGFALNEVKHWNFATSFDNINHANLKELPPNVYGFGHEKFLNHVVSSILGDSPALVEGLEGRKSLEIINAIYESAETGKEVNLRFRPQKCRLGYLTSSETR